jgi:hypothetical protein
VRAAPFSQHEAVRAGQLCAPRDRAEVLRVGDAVERDDELRAGEVVEGQVLKRPATATTP